MRQTLTPTTTGEAVQETSESTPSPPPGDLLSGDLTGCEPNVWYECQSNGWVRSANQDPKGSDASGRTFVRCEVPDQEGSQPFLRIYRSDSPVDSEAEERDRKGIDIKSRADFEKWLRRALEWQGESSGTEGDRGEDHAEDPPDDLKLLKNLKLLDNLKLKLDLPKGFDDGEGSGGEGGFGGEEGSN